jgi:hypothetical protein
VAIPGTQKEEETLESDSDPQTPCQVSPRKYDGLFWVGGGRGSERGKHAGKPPDPRAFVCSLLLYTIVVTGWATERIRRHPKTYESPKEASLQEEHI